ncbi:MAG TPA: cell envelope integrity protein TolA [Flavisolibacter sp.]|nr:cell envelope integrity protein TolA [Flavisolibacter sp.]
MTTENQSHELETEDLGQTMPVDVLDNEQTLVMQKYNIAQASINEIVARSREVKVNGPEDKEGYKKAKECLALLRTTRTSIEKKRKELKEDALREGRNIDAVAKLLASPIPTEENRLKAEVEAVDKYYEDLKAEKERLEQVKLNDRIDTLKAAGMGWNGSYYAIGDTISIDAVTLKLLPDDKFNEFVGKVEAENTRIKEAIAEQQRKEQEEKEAFEKQKEEQRLEAERLEKQRVELEQQQAEMKKQILNARIELLKGLGFVDSNLNSLTILLTTEWYEEIPYTLYHSDITVLTADQFKTEYENLKTLISNSELYKKRQNEAKAAKEAQYNARVKELYAMGFVERDAKDGFVFSSKYDDLYFLAVLPGTLNAFDEAQWTNYINDTIKQREAIINQDAQIEKENAERAEKERQARLSDSEKIQEFVSGLAEQMKHSPKALESVQYQRLVNQFDTDMEKLINGLIEALNG